MNYVKNFVFYGSSAKEIPCITGNGIPTGATEGAVGLLYMDIDTGEVYKCIAVSNNTNTWVGIGGGVSQEYVDSAIQSAILDSWEAAV